MTRPPSLPHLGPDELRERLPMARAIESMRAAFSDDREVPQRLALGVSLFMPGRVGPHTGVKVVSTVPGNPVGLVAVFGPDGSPLGLVDGPTLTAIRTGAGSGLATDLLAPPGARVLAMLGAGAMAADQVEAVRTVRPIERVVVWSRTPARAEALAERVGGEVSASPTDAVAAADVVTAATPATAPLFPAPAPTPAEAGRRFRHYNAVGAFTPSMAELPAELLHAAWVVVDDRAAAAQEAGDLLQASRTPDAEMSDLLAGRAAPPAGVPTVYKSTGIASMDIAAAVAALTP